MLYTTHIVFNSEHSFKIWLSCVGETIQQQQLTYTIGNDFCNSLLKS